MPAKKSSWIGFLKEIEEARDELNCLRDAEEEV